MKIRHGLETSRTCGKRPEGEEREGSRRGAETQRRYCILFGIDPGLKAQSVAAHPLQMQFCARPFS